MSYIKQVLDILSQRQENYADPSINHQITATMWNAFLSPRPHPIVLTPEDVCIFNILQKISRLSHATHDDSLIDIAGYVENISKLHESQRNAPKKSSVGISDDSS